MKSLSGMKGCASIFYRNYLYKHVFSMNIRALRGSTLNDFHLFFLINKIAADMHKKNIATPNPPMFSVSDGTIE